MNTPPVTIRKATPEDTVPISDLLHRLGLAVPAKDEPAKIRMLWNWLWEENPYYTHFNKELFYGWVMEDQGRIVGFFGCLPRVYHLNQAVIPVAVATRWGVEKPYRTHTHLLSDAFFRDNPIDLKITTTAIKPTTRIFDKYGGTGVPVAQIGRVLMVPIDPAVLIDFAVNGATKWKAALGKLVSLPFRLINPVAFSQRRIPPDENFQEVALEALGDDFGNFCKTFLEQTSGLVATRSPDLVRWYFRGSADRNPVKCFVYRDRARITGYAVLSDEPAKGFAKLKRYKVVDLITLDPALRKQMVQQLIRRSRLDGAHVLEFHLMGMLDRSELPAYTLSRKPVQFPAYYQCTDPGLLRELQPPDHWHVSPFDADTCLV